MDEQRMIQATQRYLEKKRALLEMQLDRPQVAERRERELRDLRSMPYKLYLTTLHWQNLRADMLSQAAGRCQQCGATTGPIDVHHLSYDRRGDESPEDLIVLCRPCHFRMPHEFKRRISE